MIGFILKIYLYERYNIDNYINLVFINECSFFSNSNK